MTLISIDRKAKGGLERSFIPKPGRRWSYEIMYLGRNNAVAKSILN